MFAVGPSLVGELAVRGVIGGEPGVQAVWGPQTDLLGHSAHAVLYAWSANRLVAGGEAAPAHSRGKNFE